MSNYATTLSIKADLEDEFLGYTKTLAIAVADGLIDDMPVDTGEARSNVFIFSGADSKARAGAYSPFPKGSGPNKSEGANRAAAKTQARRSAEMIKPFENVFIVNNAVSEDGSYYYAGDLDEGSSRQTPAGMTDRAIVMGIKKADLLWGLRSER